MAIRFRCEHCNQLMSIASRQAGLMVPCPGCARKTEVPFEDQPPSSTKPSDTSPRLYEANPETEPPLKFERPPSRSLASPTHSGPYDEDLAIVVAHRPIPTGGSDYHPLERSQREGAGCHGDRSRSPVTPEAKKAAFVALAREDLSTR